ncbi:hypothetical protein Clacol_004887 [Clathrus columnatus]|uniref:DUF5745 domain-containing protein n=1 Tax=Clathrus columnatus TaxID=1419009 RepID=A0AAV5AFD4_9AGAM|nr:hypothetical protein Clacol_004887 [Clathrus columnatus]
MSPNLYLLWTKLPSMNDLVEICIEHLVDDINELLKLLCLPLVIESPFDLTPSLFLAILESILRNRLPISSEIRDSREMGAKISAMKILLGILEDDILENDIGLSDIDPRKLAAGDLDEVVFVGRVLCDLGFEKFGLGRRRRYSDLNEQSTQGTTTNLRPSSSQANTISNTTTYSVYQESETAPTSIFDDHSSITNRLPTTQSSEPKCIHELDFSEFSLDEMMEMNDDEEDIDLNQSACDCSIQSHVASIPEASSAGTSQPSIRYEGFIGRASELEEIREFESKNGQLPKSSTSPNNTTPMRNPTQHTFPAQYTLALLHERARLLEELARLKLIRASNSLHS